MSRKCGQYKRGGGGSYWVFGVSGMSYTLFPKLREVEQSFKCKAYLQFIDRKSFCPASIKRTTINLYYEPDMRVNLLYLTLYRFESTFSGTPGMQPRVFRASYLIGKTLFATIF